MKKQTENARGLVTKKVYLSGQITGLEKHKYTSLFRTNEKVLTSFYNARIVVNPLDITPLFGIKKWFFFMVADIYQQSHCTHSAFIFNWKESRGAVIEYFFAKFVFKQGIIFLGDESEVTKRGGE